MNGTGASGDSPNHFEIPMQDIFQTPQVYSDIVSLIKKTSDEYGDLTSHKQQIQNILRTYGSVIFTPKENGKNIFHELASQPERSMEILEAFGFHEETFESLQKYAHPYMLKDLLTQRWGRKKCCPIHMAVEKGFTSYVQAMLRILPDLVSEKDGEGNLPLHYAAKSSMPEADTCMDLLLESDSSSNHDPRSYSNSLGQTPVHVLCTRVPANEDSYVKGKLEKLISFFRGEEVLIWTDNAGRTALHILCSKKDQQDDADKLSTLQDLMKAFARRQLVVNLRTEDELKQTAVHILAISEFHNLMRILVSHSHVDVTTKDQSGKMAIHYAARNALRFKSQQNVMILSEWNQIKKNLAASLGLNPHKILTEDEQLRVSDEFRKYLLWTKAKVNVSDANATTKMISNNFLEETVLTLASSSRSTKTVEFILRNAYQAKPDFWHWFDFGGKDHNPEVHSLKQVYKYTPGALQFLLDKCILINLEESNEVRVSFETELSLVTGLTKPVQRSTAISEMEYLGYAPTWPYEIQEKLLLHPLTQLALGAAWEKMLALKIIWFLFNFTWLLVHWWLIPMDYSAEGKYSANVLIPAWILLIFLVISVFEYFGRLVARDWSDVMIWVQIFLVGLSIVRPIAGSLGMPIQHVPIYLEQLCAAVGVLVTSILFWRNLSIIYLRFGIQVEYLIQTLRKIAKALVCIVVIIVGFQKAFSQILPNHFSSRFRSFTKTLVMITGEFEFDELYKNNDEDNSNETLIASMRSNSSLEPNDALSTGTSLVVFILFLIILPVTFYNLITGLVVDRIQNMESKLEMYRTRNLIRLTKYFQNSIISKLNCIGAVFERFQSYFISYRLTSDGTILYETRVKWYIDKDFVPSFGSTLCDTFNFRRAIDETITRNDNAPVYCGNNLSKSVKSKIFEMYETQLAEATKKDL